MDSHIFEKDADCVTRRIGAETIIVPVRASAIDLRAVYTLNESATEIWQRIDGCATVQHLVEELCSIYDVAPADAERDVGEVIEALCSAGLIRIAGDRTTHAL